MANRKTFRTIESVNNLDPLNPHPRLAICLCLDTSGSMSGHPINELNAGIRLFYDTIRKNRDSRLASDVAIVTFGSGGVQCLQNFSQLYQTPNPPSLTASGMTPMGEAVNLALDMIEARRQEYRAVGLPHYHPWLVLMSDGQPNGDTGEFERASLRSCALVDDRKLVVFPVGIGKDADRNSLSRFSTRIVPRKLAGMNFKAFFEWLSRSTSGVSVTTPGESVNLPPATWGTDGGWGTI